MESPKAMRYVLQVVDDPEVSHRYRLKAAEIILATGLPKNPELALALAGGGVEWLELRFTSPGQPAAASETLRIPFDDRQDVGQSVGQVIDAETDDNDVNGL